MFIDAIVESSRPPSGGPCFIDGSELNSLTGCYKHGPPDGGQSDSLWVYKHGPSDGGHSLLLFPQCYHRIYLCRPSSRNVARQQRHACEQQGDTDER